MVKLTRLAGDRLAAAIEQALAAANEGNDYADHLVADSGAATTAAPSPGGGGADKPPTASGADSPEDPAEPGTSRNDSSEPARQSAAERREAIRRRLLEYGSDVGEEASAIVEPIYQPPEPLRGSEVDDPIGALTVSATIMWELLSRWIDRTRGR